MRILILAVLLASCANPTAPPPPVSPCAEERFEQAGFIVCRGGEVQIRTGMRSFKTLQAQLGARSDDVGFAMNGGMFDDAGAPIGLAVEDGREVHAINRREGGGNFHLMPNGVFVVRSDGRAEVVTSAAYKPAPDIAFAAQSGPMLVIDSKLHPKFDPDGASRYVRNAVGIGRDGKPVFVITTDVVSFGALAGEAPADQRLPGSLALALKAAEQGAQLIRVHDVPETVQALKVWRGLRDAALTPRG